MHIYIDNGSTPMLELDLPEDFNAELSRTNPFLTDEGSQSIPLTIPITENNMKLLGWTYRPNSTHRPFKRVPAVLVDNTLHIKGEIVTTEAHPIDGISASFYYQEGRLYEKIKDLKLGDIPWPRYEGPYNGLDANVSYWMNYLLASMEIEIYNQDFYVFSVITDEEHIVYKDEELKDAKEMQKLILNKFVSYNKEVYFYAETTHTYYSDFGDNATEYTLPVGYGVTPFLRLRYILTKIFEHLGYTFDTTYFDEDISLSRLCLINNTADAITGGFLDYSQLIPAEETIEDFLELCQKNLGFKFVEESNTIRMVYWRELLSAHPDQDLSAYIRNHAAFIKVDPKSILIQYEPTYELPDSVVEKQTLKRMPDKGVEEVDLSTQNQLCFHDSVYLYIFGEGTIWYLTAPRIKGINHQNTDLINEDEETVEEKNNKLDIIFCFSIPEKQRMINPPVSGTDQGTHVPGAQFGTQEYWYYGGSIHSYNYQNEIWGSFSLVANEITADINPDKKDTDNIFNSFYQELERFYRHANQQLTMQALVPAHIISSMDITKPKIINGMKVLIERIDYVLGRPDLCEITAYSMHEYED